MRAIRKRPEPAYLTEYRRIPQATYEALQQKDALRNALVSEQRGLCCYCMQGIRPEWDSVKIEHWHAQSKYPEEQLQYWNLLASCTGNERAKLHPKYRHCDTCKSDRDLSRNPANPSHQIEALVRYRIDGGIYSDNIVFDSEINEILNLNAPHLVSERQATLSGFLKGLPSGSLSRDRIRRLLDQWTGEPETLRPFCQIVIYWLRQRL